MVILNELESQYLNLLENEISLQDFEQWVYASKWLESTLSEAEYIDLISLNCNKSGARHDLGNILKKQINEGRFQTVRFVRLLDSIINRDGKEGESLSKMYDWYCHGYNFLYDLGLGIGLQINVPTRYGVNYCHELNDTQKTELVGSAYPMAAKLAQELKIWILTGQLVLTGEKDPDFNRWYYADYRNEEDRQSRVWEVVDRDEKTNAVRASHNTLLDKYGDFIQNAKTTIPWLKRFVKR